MNNLLQTKIQNQTYKIVLWQFIGIIVLAVPFLIFVGFKSGFSVFAGGLAYALPNLIFVWAVFRFVGAQKIQQFMLAFFFGEMFKLFLSAILFVLIVKYLPISLLSVLGGFIGAMIAFWFACVTLFAKKGVV